MSHSSTNVGQEIIQEDSQTPESQLSKFQNQYKSTLNYFLNRPTKREDIIKALPYTLEIIETLADKLLDPTKKIEFKELSKLTTKELEEIKTGLTIINQRNDRPETPTFDQVRDKCSEIIDTLIENKKEAKKNRYSFFSAVRKFSRFIGTPQASDLNQTASLTINQKFTDIKGILAPQNEIDIYKADQEIANILKENTNKLRNLHAVGAENSGGKSSRGGAVEVKFTFGASDTGSDKSEPNATLAGPTLTPRQIEIADKLSGLNVGRSTPPLPSSRPPAPGGLPRLIARRSGLSRSPSASPSSPKKSSLVDRVLESLGSDSAEAKNLEEATQKLVELRKKHAELRKKQKLGRRDSNGNGESR
jgi:hypothetical protein